MPGGEADEMGEAFNGDGVAVMHEAADGFGHGHELGGGHDPDDNEFAKTSICKNRKTSQDVGKHRNLQLGFLITITVFSAASQT